jgi:hypothetical protein
MNKKGMSPSQMTGFKMVGGIDINVEEMKKLPDANYWRSGALWAESQIYNTLGGYKVEDRVEKILARFWSRKNTWMTICLRVEHMLDLIKAIVGRKNEQE